MTRIDDLRALHEAANHEGPLRAIPDEDVLDREKWKGALVDDASIHALLLPKGADSQGALLAALWNAAPALLDVASAAEEATTVDPPLILPTDDATEVAAWFSERLAPLRAALDRLNAAGGASAAAAGLPRGVRETHGEEQRMNEYMLDVAAIRKAPVGRIAALSADLFNGPDPVPGIEVELPLEQVEASTIGADVALVAPADLAALCDEVDALCDEVAARDAENERLRGLLWKASSVIGALVEPQCGNDTGFALRAKAAAVLDDLRAALREGSSHA